MHGDSGVFGAVLNCAVVLNDGVIRRLVAGELQTAELFTGHRLLHFLCAKDDCKANWRLAKANALVPFQRLYLS